MAFKFVSILLCFNSLRAISIEIILIIISSISTILEILGIIFIPWKITYSIIEVLFFLVLIFSCLSLIITILIHYLRLHNKLSKRKTKILIVAVIIMGFICLFTLILLIIISCTIFTNISKKEYDKVIEEIEETGEIQKTTYLNRNLASTTKKIMTIIIISLLLALWVVLLFLWASEYVRFYYGISCSYKKFVVYEREKQLKHPKRYGLIVIGHNKFGFPIYGKIKGNKIIIEGAQNIFEEKKCEKINDSGKYFDGKGKINVKYYSKSSNSEQMTQEKIKEKIQEKEEYIEKYFDGENVFQNYTNFENKTILNYDDNNNSINVGYAY